MTRVVIVFLDGVGLGEDDAQVNPLAAARLPVLTGALGGRRLVVGSGRIDAAQATMIPTDAGLGVKGRPQSATGQTALLTGRNAPLILGEHYGPRPNAALRAMLEGPTLFTRLLAEGRTVAFANAYPQGYFDAVARGKRLHGAIPHAAQAAGLRLRTADDLRAGQALSVDLTNAAWHNAMGYPDMPLWTPFQAGKVLAQLSAGHDLVRRTWPATAATWSSARACWRRSTRSLAGCWQPWTSVKRWWPSSAITATSRISAPRGTPRTWCPRC